MKRRQCAPLSSPQEKRRGGGGAAACGSPLPVPVSTLTGAPPSNSSWAVYHGRVTSLDRGHRVVIRDPVEATTVYSNGYFGDLVTEGRLEDKARPVLEDWTPDLGKSQLKTDTDHGHGSEAVTATATSWDEIKTTTRDSSDGHDVCLHLELCEAFFLSYSLGCLVILPPVPGPAPLSLSAQWRLFTRLEPDFPVRYRVYHHYRVRGWCVRAGLTMGADWVLYKASPALHHSTYTLRLEMVDRRTGASLAAAGLKGVTWAELLGHTRVMGTVKKDLLVVRVTVSADRRDWSSPFCLNSMGVSSHRVRRWVPGDQRWKTKPKVPILTID